MEIKIFGTKAKICKSFFSKFKGLMFIRRRNAKPLFFVFPKEQKIPLHMLFVLFPIRVVCFNKEKKIVEKRILKPFQFWMSRKKAKYILEIPV